VEARARLSAHQRPLPGADTDVADDRNTRQGQRCFYCPTAPQTARHRSRLSRFGDRQLSAGQLGKLAPLDAHPGNRWPVLWRAQPTRRLGLWAQWHAVVFWDICTRELAQVRSRFQRGAKPRLGGRVYRWGSEVRRWVFDQSAPTQSCARQLDCLSLDELPATEQDFCLVGWVWREDQGLGCQHRERSLAQIPPARRLGACGGWRLCKSYEKNSLTRSVQDLLCGVWRSPPSPSDCSNWRRISFWASVNRTGVSTTTWQ